LANSTSNAALVAHVFAPNTTTIDGGKITTGSIRANQMYANKLVNTGAYNSDGTINGAAVTMEIDLGAGSIYIK